MIYFWQQVELFPSHCPAGGGSPVACHWSVLLCGVCYLSGWSAALLHIIAVAVSIQVGRYFVFSEVRKLL